MTNRIETRSTCGGAAKAALGLGVLAAFTLGIFMNSAYAERRHYWGRGYYGPPIVYGSPYYEPPPVIYGPGIGINVPFVSIGIH
jgi:hypothetical protein